MLDLDLTSQCHSSSKPMAPFEREMENGYVVMWFQDLMIVVSRSCTLSTARWTVLLLRFLLELELGNISAS